MHRSRSLALAVGALTAVALALPAVTTSSSAAPATGTKLALSAKTVAQIDALNTAKSQRTPAERKIESRLLTEIQQQGGRRVAAGVGPLATGIKPDKSGAVPVVVTGDVASFLPLIRAAKGVVLSSSVALGSVRADVPLNAVEPLARAASVTHINVADPPVLADASAPIAAGATSAAGPDARRAFGPQLQAAVAKTATGPRPAVGSATSEGDATEAVDTARAQFHVSGVGVTVGVLSDGVDSLADAIKSGDLPAGTHALPGREGEGDEGTAMMEIIHDLAPKAALLFATANPTDAAFADNIRALRQAGADIIVDDVLYYDEPTFQDGPIAQAVTDVTNDGALYFSSAGNEGNNDDKTSGTWEGEFVSSGQTIGKVRGLANDFNPGTGVQAVDPITTGSIGVPAILQWNDPVGHSGNDYDLYAVAADGTVLAESNTTQDGDGTPFEAFVIPFGTQALAVVKYKGAARYLQLTAFRGQFRNRSPLVGYHTPGETRGHSTVPAAFNVAAAPAADPLPFQVAPGVSNPSGPYPGVFTAAQQSEVFTSDGPRRIYYRANGTPITPNNLGPTGGTVRRKPDLTAADGVTTSLSDFTPFFGTSAAAPHAAAIAALVLSGNPGITPAEVRTALTSTAIDIEAHGYDRDTGYGIVMADRVLHATGATPQPRVVAGSPTVTPVTGDGDQYLEPGESADLAIPATNTGDGTAHSVSVHVTSNTPGVTVTPAQRSYGTLAVGQTKTATPLRIKVPANFPVGESIALNVRVSFVGYLSPQTRAVTIPTGQPSNAVTTVSYTGPAKPIPDASTTGVTVPLTVSHVGRVSKVTFSIDGATCTKAAGATTVGIDHTYVADLVGTLTAPDGSTVTLFSRAGGSGNNICQALFTDAASVPFDQNGTDDAPFTGSWLPTQPLSRFVSTPGDGSWKFTVRDVSAIDTGSVRAFSLHLSGYVGGTS